MRFRCLDKNLTLRGGLLDNGNLCVIRQNRSIARFLFEAVVFTKGSIRVSRDAIPIATSQDLRSILVFALTPHGIGNDNAHGAGHVLGNPGNMRDLDVRLMRP